MTVHNLYLFDRNGACLHYSEWNRKKQAGISKEEVSPPPATTGPTWEGGRRGEHCPLHALRGLGQAPLRGGGVSWTLRIIIIIIIYIKYETQSTEHSKMHHKYH